MVGKGQVQNCRWYIRYRNSFQKSKAEECKKLAPRTHLFAILMLHLLDIIVPLTIMKFEKTNTQITILFIFFFLSFFRSFFHLFFRSFSLCITRKLYGEFVLIFYRMTALLMEINPTSAAAEFIKYWGRGAN